MKAQTAPVQPEQDQLIPLKEMDEPIGQVFGRMRLYRIFRLSENTNSFGLRGMWVMRRNGECWEVGISDFARDGRQKGDVVKVAQMHKPNAKPSFNHCEIPEFKAMAPPEVIAAVWGGARQSNIKGWI